MKKTFKNLILGGVIALAPMVGAQLSIEYNQSFNTNGSKIVSNLLIDNTSNLIDSEGSFYQQNIPADLAGRGATNMNNGVYAWAYETVSENESKMFKEDGVGYPLYPGLASTFHYNISTNKVVGWETLTANMEAPAGTVDFDYTLPLTRSTTTHTNGVSLGMLVDSGLATNGSSRAEFEAASVHDGNANGRPDVLDWLISGDTNYTGNLETQISFTNGNPTISWTPSVSNRVYGVEVKTNLLDATWMNAGSVTNTGNGENSFEATNVFHTAFLSLEVALP